jgi:nitrogen fixation/metabolism regulation signal transduction histidine kinase
VALSGRLARRLLVAFLFVALVPLALLATFGPRLVRGRFETLSRDRVADVLDGVSRDLELRREGIRLQVEALAADPALVRRLALADATGTPELALIDDVVERRGALGLDWLEVTDAEGVVLARGHDRGTFGLELSEDPIIAAALSGQPLAAVSELAPPDSGLALLAANPVVFEGRVLGVVRGGVLLDTEFLTRLKALSGAELEVVGAGGAISASTLAPDLGARVAARVAGLAPDSTVAFELERVPYRLGALPLVGLEGRELGRLAVGVSQADLVRTLESLLRLLGAAALIGLLVAVGVALVFATRISRPVRALAHAAQRVAKGDLAVRLPAGPNDEVGELMSAFNAMTVDLSGSRERLVRGERQAAWSQVARRLAHEIKNPLTPIQLSIEDAERARARGEADFDEVLARASRTIKAEVRTLRDLVREFSEFAQSREPRPEPLDLREVIDHALDLYVPSSVTVERDYAKDAARIEADRDLLARAFGNLVKNACEAMEGRGTLKVETRSFDGTIEVAIADTGPGVSPDDRERIFTPYFTTKAEGTGLGLALVRRIVEDHGGTLELDAGTAGARFVVRLPARASRGGTGEAASREAGGTNGPRAEETS